MNPHRLKYHDLYWNTAYEAAAQSESKVVKVGAVLVTATGLISPGWNGMPAGLDNCCEDRTCFKIDEVTGKKRHPTRPEVIHAERNAIDKLTRQGIPTANSVLFVTLAPCFECAKAIHALGFKAIVYDFVYKDPAGIEFLARYAPVIQRKNAARFTNIFG